jgi:Dihydrodipicolinate reductase, N-terminus
MLPPYPNPSERGDSELSETRVLRICLAGVTGWQGVPLSEALINAPDLHLSAGVARSAAGKQLRNGAPVYGDVESALEAVPVDVFIDYTAPNAVARHARTAIESTATKQATPRQPSSRSILRVSGANSSGCETSARDATKRPSRARSITSSGARKRI